MKIVRNRTSGTNTWTIKSKNSNVKTSKLHKSGAGNSSSSQSFEEEAPKTRTTRSSLRDSSNASFSPGVIPSPFSKEPQKVSPLKRRLSSSPKDKSGAHQSESDHSPRDEELSELQPRRRIGRPPKNKFRKLVHFNDSDTVHSSSPNTSLRVSLTELPQTVYERKRSAISSGSETDTPNPDNVRRELRPRRTVNSSFSYSDKRRHSKRNSSSPYQAGHRTRLVETTGQMTQTSSNDHGCKLLDKNADVQQSDAAGDGDDDDDDDEQREHDDEEQHSEGRRYPVRNRRNTAVYQVQIPQNNTHHHPHHRRWMTTELGHEMSRRIRRHNGRYSRHRGPDSGSSSSSNQSNSDTSSDSLRNPVSDRYRRHPSNTSYWVRPTSDASDKPSSRLNAMDEQLFEQRRTKSILHARSELMPINLNQLDHGKSTLNKRLLAGTSLADIEPMSLDTTVGFDQVAGHECHITALKESIILPLMYPEIFSQFGIAPPQGCLFTGPPGTGKTLLARALANECTRLNQASATDQGHIKRRPIAFFMRKGADCLSKWVGESERHLRLLFDQAYRMRPSIIFFDEIDGLAPVRSSKQDQIHSSIVSTLLSLMDGLDNRAEVVVIGATNRPDSLDPALRRPGRFDREFQFGLPVESVRKQILAVQTRKWNPKPDDELLNQLAAATNNFSGADLKALTTEACLCCLRRCYPQVYNSQVKLALDFRYLVVNRSDWFKALQVVRASSERCDADLSAASLSPSANALSATTRLPLQPNLARLLQSKVDGLAIRFLNALVAPSELPFKFSSDLPQSYLPKSKILLSGNVPDCLMDAVWHRLESIQVYTLNLANLVAFPSSIGVCPEAAIAQIVSAIRCAVKKSPPLSIHNQSKSGNPTGVIIYMPRIDALLKRLTNITASYLVERLNGLMHEINSDWMMRLDLVGSVPGAGYSTISTHYTSRILLVATLDQTAMCLSGLGLTTKKNTDNKVSPVPLKHSVVRVGLLNSSPNQGRTPKHHIPNGHRTSDLTCPNHTSLQSPTERPYNSLPSKHRLPPPTLVRSIPNHIDSSMDGHPNHVYPPGFHTPAASDSTTSLPNNVEHDQNSDEDESDHFSAIFNNSPMKPSAQMRPQMDHLLTGLFDKELVDLVQIESPDCKARAAFYSPVLLEWPKLFPNNQTQEQSGQDEGDRPPTPQPVPNTPDPVESYYKRLSKEELAEMERQETQLFRRLRQILRRVVAHLLRHRRFVVFSRPVQLDEAPDYYEVIKEPIDLGMVRDKIDSHQYTNVDDFMHDLELIHLNALEYNPANVPRSRDIRSRAFEFWDEACLCLEEELDPPDLNEQCKAAILARSIRMAKQANSEDLTPRVARSSTTSATPTHHSKRKSIPHSPKPIQPKLPPPLPQGDRYSRRLHGEPPILGTEDVQQLESISRRRSNSHHLETSLTENPGSPTRKSKDSIDLDSCPSKATVTDTVKTRSSVDQNPELVTSSPVSSPNKTNPVRTMSPQTHSPNLDTTHTTPAKDPLPTRLVTSTMVPAAAPTSIQLKLNMAKLEEFYRTVISQTEGWSIDQLINLYTDFVKVVWWRYGCLTDRSQMHLDLEHVFKLHSDVASTRASFV